MSNKQNIIVYNIVYVYNVYICVYYGEHTFFLVFQLVFRLIVTLKKKKRLNCFPRRAVLVCFCLGDFNMFINGQHYIYDEDDGDVQILYIILPIPTHFRTREWKIKTNTILALLLLSLSL